MRKNIPLIFLASILYAVSISLFLNPNHLAPGGVTGIAMILNRLFFWETGTWVLLLNIPLLLLGAWKFGKRFALMTLCAIGLSGIFMNLLVPFGPLTADPLLAALAGAALLGVGIGLIFKAGATTGGMDIVVRLLRLRVRHLKSGIIYLIADAAVVLLYGLFFREVDRMLYAGIAIVCSSRIMDLVIYGTESAKLIYIISNESEKLTRRLTDEVETGVTLMEGRGGYSGETKEVILCVVHKRRFPEVEEIIKETDPDAFIIVTGATEIFGEGYQDIWKEKV